MKYPIVAFLDRDKNIYSFDKKDSEICSIDLIEKFNNAVFYDSDLNKHLISNAEKISWAYFYGYHPLLKGRSVKIRFKIDRSEKVSLKDVKNALILKLENGVEPGFWYSKKDIPKLTENVHNAHDFNSLVKIFSEDIQE